MIIDVQRVGPSTGMPTRNQQSDVKSFYRLSHGDTEHVVLMPSGPEEIYELTQQALDLAERLQTVVFVLTELDMGMNIWMSNPFKYPERPFDRGKVLEGAQAGGRVRAPRTWTATASRTTLPGTHHPKAPYFTRGSSQPRERRLHRGCDRVQGRARPLKKKIAGSVKLTPKPIIDGGRHRPDPTSAARPSRWRRRATSSARQGVRTAQLPRVRAAAARPGGRVRAQPASCTSSSRTATASTDIVRLKALDAATKVKSILDYGGLPMPATPIVEALSVGKREPVHV